MVKNKYSNKCINIRKLDENDGNRIKGENLDIFPKDSNPKIQLINRDNYHNDNNDFEDIQNESIQNTSQNNNNIIHDNITDDNKETNKDINFSDISDN